MTCRSRWLAPLVLLLSLPVMQASARKHRFQLTVEPTISAIPTVLDKNSGSPFPTEITPQTPFTANNDTQINRVGAGASLQAAYELVAHDSWSSSLWLQGGVTANAVGGQAQLAQATLQHALLGWNVLLGTTFRLNIDHLIFRDRTSRLGALLEAGLGLAGATVNAQTLLPLLPGQGQVDIALISGAYSLGTHLGIGLDYWISRRLVIGIIVASDIAVTDQPAVRILRAPNGEAYGKMNPYGTINIGPRLSLRL